MALVIRAVVCRGLLVYCRCWLRISHFTDWLVDLLYALCHWLSDYTSWLFWSSLLTNGHRQLVIMLHILFLFNILIIIVSLTLSHLFFELISWFLLDWLIKIWSRDLIFRQYFWIFLRLRYETSRRSKTFIALFNLMMTFWIIASLFSFIIQCFLVLTLLI